MIRNLLFLLVALASFAQCATERSSSREQGSKSGLQIDNSPTRGSGFTDSFGLEHGLVYITCTLTNGSSIPLQLQLTMPTQVPYPSGYGEATFNIILLPEEWSLDGFDITDQMIAAIPEHKTSSFLTKTLLPGEEHAVTIGLTRLRRAGLCSATPYALLEFADRGNYPSCDWPVNEDKSLPSPLELGLKVGFCTVGEKFESCIIIPCGRVVQPEQ